MKAFSPREIKAKILARRFAALTAGLVILFLLAAGGYGIYLRSPVKVGVVFSLSGDYKQEAKAQLDAVKLFFRELNTSGGVLGRRFELVIRDDAHDPEKALEVAEEFAQDPDIVAVIGHMHSSEVLAVTQTYSNAGLALLTPGATNREAAQLHNTTFSMLYNDDYQGRSLVQYLRAVMDARRVALVYATDIYAAGLARSFREAAATLEMEIGPELPLDTGQNVGPGDFAMLQAAQEEYDAVVYLGQSAEGAAFVRELRRLGVEKPVLGPDAMFSPDFLKLVGASDNNLFVATPFLYSLGTLASDRFLNTYNHEYGQRPSIWCAFAYDAAGLVARAVKQEGLGRQDVRRYLDMLDSSAEAVDGVTGRIWFDEAGSVPRPVYMSQPHDGYFLPAFTQLKKLPSEIDNPGAFRYDQTITLGEDLMAMVKVVHTGVDVLRIIEIDEGAQLFSAEFFIWFKWSGNVDLDSIQFINSIISPDDRLEVIRQSDYENLHYVCFRGYRTFLTPFNLRWFPFDTQELIIDVGHRNKDAYQFMLAMDEGNLGVPDSSIIYPEGWDFVDREDFSGSYTQFSSLGDPEYGGFGDRIEFSIYKSGLIVHRALLPYLLTLFLPLFIMLAISLMVFFIPVDNLQAGLMLTMTSLLSIIVFHLSQKDKLPKVGYMVYSDYFFIFAYALLSALILEVVYVFSLAAAGRKVNVKGLHAWFGRLLIPATVAIYFGLTIIALR